MKCNKKWPITSKWKWEYEEKCHFYNHIFREGLQLQILITAICMIVVMIVIMKRNTEKKWHNSQLEVRWQKRLMRTLLDLNLKELPSIEWKVENLLQHLFIIIIIYIYIYIYIRKERGTTQGRKCCRNNCFIEVMFTVLSKHWWTKKNLFR